jgi:hypothetical protein
MLCDNLHVYLGTRGVSRPSVHEYTWKHMSVVGIEGKHYWCGSSSAARGLWTESPPLSSPAWACTRPSCIAFLRTVSVVARPPCGLRRLDGRLARGRSQSVEPLAGRFVGSSTRLQDEWDEVVLVGVLRRFDRGVGLCCLPHVYLR